MTPNNVASVVVVGSTATDKSTMEKSADVNPKDSPAAANSAGKSERNDVSNWVVVTEARLVTCTSADTRYKEVESALRCTLAPKFNACSTRPRSSVGLEVVALEPVTSTMRNDNSWSVEIPRKDRSALRTTARWDAMLNDTAEPSATEIENCSVALPDESTREVELGAAKVDKGEVDAADGLGVLGKVEMGADVLRVVDLVAVDGLPEDIVFIGNDVDSGVDEKVGADDGVNSAVPV